MCFNLRLPLERKEQTGNSQKQQDFHKKYHFFESYAQLPQNIRKKFFFWKVMRNLFGYLRELRKFACWWQAYRNPTQQKQWTIILKY